MDINGRIQLCEEIGRGSFSTVYRALVISDNPPLEKGQIVAVKAISSKQFPTKQEREKAESEIRLMMQLYHKNIVRLFGVEKTEGASFLIMEYCEQGDLGTFMKRNSGGLSLEMIHNFAKQIGEGLEYLKSKNIVHRDLKPQNIMMMSDKDDMVLKIADFGLARFLHHDEMAESVCGSPLFMAPEIQFGLPYTCAVDMWSLGIIIYQMITANHPFPRCKTAFQLSNELKNHTDSTIKIPPHYDVPAVLRDLVSKLLTFDSEVRMTLDEYIKHEFFGNELSEDITRERNPKFSFSHVIKNGSEETPEKIVNSVFSAADSIEALFTECQDVGDAVLFDLLTTMCEFLLDVLKECIIKESTTFNDRIIKLILRYHDEASELERTDMEEPSTTALQFLFKKGLDYSRNGITAELEGDKSFAKIKYSKAIDIICPLVFLKTRDENVMHVRQLYDQLMMRINTLG